MADKDKIIQQAIRNMQAGKLSQAFKLTQRREVERTAVAKALGGLIMCKGGNVEQGEAILRAVMSEPSLDYRAAAFADEGASIAGLYTEAASMWGRLAAAKPDDKGVAYHHVLALMRKGELAASQKLAASIAKATDSPYFLEVAALINHMLATDEMLAGKMPVMGQEGASSESVSGTSGGMTLSVALAQLEKAMPTDTLPIDKDGAVIMDLVATAASKAKEAAGGAGAAAAAAAESDSKADDSKPTPEPASRIELPASSAATLLTVHTLRRLGRYEEALRVLDTMSSRHRVLVEAAAATSAKAAAERHEELRQKHLKAEAEAKAIEGGAAAAASDAAPGADAAASGAGAAADADAAASTATGGDAAAAVTEPTGTSVQEITAALLKPKEHEDMVTRSIESAASFARRRQVPLARRRAEAIDLRCAMGDWAGAYAETIRLLRESPGDVRMMAAAIQCCLQATAAKPEAATGPSPGLDAVCHPIAASPDALVTDSAAEAAIAETEAGFVRDALQRQILDADSRQLRQLRLQIFGARSEPTRAEVASFRASCKLSDRVLAVEDSEVPAPSVTHVRGILRATQAESAATFASASTRKGIDAMTAALGHGSEEEDKDAKADAEKPAEIADEPKADKEAGAGAEGEEAAGEDEGEGEGEDSRAPTGGRMELGALLIETDLELRVLDASEGKRGTGGALPEGTADMPGGAAVVALAEAGDPAALFVALVARCATRFAHVLMLPRELRLMIEPFVTLADVGLSESDVDAAELERAAAIRWRAASVPREVLAVAGDHVRAAPAPSLFGENSPYNAGESPLRGGMRSPAFKVSAAARAALATVLKAVRDANTPGADDREALAGAFSRAVARYEKDIAEYNTLREAILAAQERGDKEEVAKLGRSFNRTPPQVHFDGKDSAVAKRVELKASKFQCAARILRSIGETAPATIGEEGCVAEVKRLAEAFGNVEPLMRLVNPSEEGAPEEGVADMLLLLLARTMSDVADARWKRAVALRAAGDDAAASAAERSWWQSLLDTILMLQTRASARVPGQVSLLLMQLYSRAGAMGPVHQLFNALGVRSLSLESISYLFLPHALRLGGYTEARDLCTAILDMHVQNDRVLPGRIAAAASRSNVAAALDLALFRRRLEHSLQRSEAQSIVGVISIPSDRLNTTRDWLREKVGPSGTGMGCDPDFFCPMSLDTTTALCTDNIDREVAIEFDPPAGPLSSVGRRAAAYRNRNRTLVAVENRRLLMLALHAVSNSRPGPLATILPALTSTAARLGLLPAASAPADSPLAPLLLVAPEGSEPALPAEGEGFDGVGLRHIGTHAVSATATHAMWGSAILSLRAAAAVLRAFKAPEVAAGTGLRAARATAEPGTVDFEACEEAKAALSAVGDGAEALVDAIIGDPLVMAEGEEASPAAAAAAAAASGAGAGARAGEATGLQSPDSWRERILRPASIVAASRFVGEVMAVLPVAFGAMAAYVPKPDSKAAKSKGSKSKRVVKTKGKATKAKAPASPEAKAADEVLVLLAETAYRLCKALDRLGKTLSAARSGLTAGPKKGAAAVADWTIEASLVPTLMAGRDGDSKIADATKALIDEIRASWTDSLGRMQDTLRDRTAMLRDASVL
ncbi:hypothetical protein FNF29_02122 [Cafeteria roenbergensis]|uniref:Uncharacterized protein n=1 Tax=Cafeteria roenbergensis TaxID=33653 RepID=A0A5A8CQI9_CAFRO|nr:hypothetical protein FNF29_02122 [Cafeteria roenbergensis]|eukprot:KAA0154978.1 hypothetical protein FNF29_02122 [Cafeteria roenbergensis]